MAEVSIIVPVYNVEKYLARCLDSLTSQSFRDIEIICVNDGSTDNSPDILNHYAKFDERITVVNKPNGGLSSARNAGIEKAAGKYLMFVDSDDWLSSVAVEKLYENAEQNNSDVVLFNYMTGDVIPKRQIVIEELGDKYINTPFNINSLSPDLYKVIPMSACFRFYRSDLIKNKIKFDDDIIYEDCPFMAKIFATAKRITHLPEAFYYYYQGRNDNIMSDKGRKMFDIIKVMDRWEDVLKKYGHFKKFGRVFYLIIMLNFIQKFYMISPKYKEEFFNNLRNNHRKFDYDYYLNGSYSDVEKLQVKQFKLMQEPDMTFEKFIKLPFEVKYARGF